MKNYIVTNSILLLFFLVPISVFAQDPAWEQIKKEYNPLFDQGNYKEAYTVAEKMLHYAQKNFSKDNPNYALAYEVFGNILYYLNDNDKALAYYDTSLTLFSNNFTEENHNTAVVRQMTGVAYLSAKNYPEAEKFLLQSLQLYKTLKKENSRVTENYMSLSELYYDIESYDKAESAIIKAIQMVENKFPSNYADMSRYYNALSEIQIRTKEFSKSRESAVKALEAAQRVTNFQEIIHSNNLLGIIAHRESDFLRAKSYYLKAYSYIPSLDPAKAEKRIIYSGINLGGIYTDLKLYDSSLYYCNLAQGILSKDTSQRYQLEQFMLYEKFGNLYSGSGQKKKAIDYYRAALALNQKHTCVSPSLYTEILFITADAYEQVNQKDSVSFYYKEAARSLGVKDAKAYRSFISHRNIGDSLARRRIYKEALDHYKQSLAFGKKMTEDSDHKYFGAIYYNMATSYLASENIPQATKAASRAAAIFHRQGGETDSDYLKTLKMLAHCYHLSGDQQKSDALLKEYSRIKLALGED